MVGKIFGRLVLWAEMALMAFAVYALAALAAWLWGPEEEGFIASVVIWTGFSALVWMVVIGLKENDDEIAKILEPGRLFYLLFAVFFLAPFVLITWFVYQYDLSWKEWTLMESSYLWSVAPAVLIVAVVAGLVVDLLLANAWEQAKQNWKGVLCVVTLGVFADLVIWSAAWIGWGEASKATPFLAAVCYLLFLLTAIYEEVVDKVRQFYRWIKIGEKAS